MACRIPNGILFCMLFCVTAGTSLLAEDAALLIDQGHYKQARAMLEKRIAADSKDAEALILLAKIKLTNKFDEAIQLAKQAISLKPNSASAHAVLGQCYLEKVNRVSIFQKLGVGHSIRSEFEQAFLLTGMILKACGAGIF